MILRLLLVILFSCIWLSCEKDKSIEFKTVKPKYEIEGQYVGELHVIVKKYNNYNKTYPNTWNITSFNGERLAIETNSVTASANMLNDGLSYEYIPYFTYLKECTTIVFKYSGDGEVRNDTLRESGDVIIYYGSEEMPMYGTFSGWAVKQK